ncbi:RNA-binding protein CP29B [Spatholobus suberectus]|nr:RNA-binding protein CP29B [Spatholobus suberectus]
MSSFSSCFVSHVIISSKLEHEEDALNDGDNPNFSLDLKLFVKNPLFNFNNAQLAELFKNVGNVELVEVIYDKTLGEAKGLGKVEDQEALDLWLTVALKRSTMQFSP